MQGRKKGGKGSHTTPGRNHYGAFFFAETFRSFSLRQIGHGNISVICLTFVFKRAVSVLISLYIQTFWPKRQNFFGHFRIISVYDRKMTEKNSYEAPNLCGGAPKSPNYITSTFFNAGQLLPRDLSFEHGAQTRFMPLPACDCWTQTSWQVMQRNSDTTDSGEPRIVSCCVKRSMSKSVAVLPQIVKKPIVTEVQWFVTWVQRSRFWGSTKVIWNMTESVELLYYWI